MAATFVDDERLNEDSQQTELDFDDPSQADGDTHQDHQDAVPDKYAGKSVQEIVRMHQEAEKLLGRQSAEVGDLRKVVDQYIQTQLSSAQASNQQKQENPEDEIDFFSDPEKAVQRAIDNHPKVRQAEQFNIQLKNKTLYRLYNKNTPI